MAVAAAVPEARIVAVTMPELEPNRVALAEAGISGYVSREGSIDDLVGVSSVSRGETLCSPQMTATLMRRVTVLAAEGSLPSPPHAEFSRGMRRDLMQFLLVVGERHRTGVY